MSLLLDALKKAAEEKQKKQGQETTEQPATTETQDSLPQQTTDFSGFESFASTNETTATDQQPAEQNENESEHNEHLLDFNDEPLDNSQEEEDTSLTEPPQHQNSLDFVADNQNEQQEQEEQVTSSAEQKDNNNKAPLLEDSQEEDEEEEPFDFDALSASLSNFDLDDEPEEETEQQEDTQAEITENKAEDTPLTDQPAAKPAETEQQEETDLATEQENIEYEDASSWDEEKATKAKKLFASKDYLQKQESKKKLLKLFSWLMFFISVAGGSFYWYINQGLNMGDLASFSVQDKAPEPYQPVRKAIEKQKQETITAATAEKQPIPAKTEPQAPVSPQAAVPETTTRQQQAAQVKATAAGADQLQAEQSNKPATQQQSNQNETRAEAPKEQHFPVKQLTFIKTSNQKQIHKQLSDAYYLYHSGDLAQALELYKKVYQQDKENKDALLGIAAIALVNGNKQKARAIYRQLGELYPDDPAIKTAMDGLSNQNREALSARFSQLKRLLTHNPDSAELQFAMGNLLAEESRWAEAQKYYFQAYRLKPDNPDYIFNLAVSLDYLSQFKQAIRFYELALTEAEEKVSSFNEKSVINRIDALRAATEAK